MLRETEREDTWTVFFPIISIFCSLFHRYKYYYISNKNSLCITLVSFGFILIVINKLLVFTYKMSRNIIK